MAECLTQVDQIRCGRKKCAGLHPAPAVGILKISTKKFPRLAELTTHLLSNSRVVVTINKDADKVGKI